MRIMLILSMAVICAACSQPSVNMQKATAYSATLIGSTAVYDRIPADDLEDVLVVHKEIIEGIQKFLSEGDLVVLTNSTFTEKFLGVIPPAYTSYGVSLLSYASAQRLDPNGKVSPKVLKVLNSALDGALLSIDTYKVEDR